MTRATLRQKALAAAIVAVLAAAPVRADLPLAKSQFAFSDRWSAGFMLGAPTGGILKRHLGNGQGWDVGLGLLYSPGFRLHGDWFWTLGQFKPDASLQFRFLLGGGLLVGVTSGPCHFYSSFSACDGTGYAGVRVPFQVEAWPSAAAINFGIELAPGLAVGTGGAGFLLDGNLFVRFLL